MTQRMPSYIMTRSLRSGLRKATSLAAAGVDGMVNPFALEVLRNPDLLPFEVPFVEARLR